MNTVSERLQLFACRLLGVKLYMTLFGWFGASVHEISHALMCIIFRHKIEKIQFFTLNTDTGRAGYVSHRYNPESFYQKIGNLFIGIAPVFSGSVIIFFSAQFLLPEILDQTPDLRNWSNDIFSGISNTFVSLISILFDFKNYTQWKFYLFVYILFCIGSSMKLSRSDLRGAWIGFVALVSLLLLVNISLNFISPEWSTTLSEHMTFIMQQGFLIYNMILFVIIMNILILGPMVLITKM